LYFLLFLREKFNFFYNNTFTVKQILQIKQHGLTTKTKI